MVGYDLSSARYTVRLEEPEEGTQLAVRRTPPNRTSPTCMARASPYPVRLRPAPPAHSLASARRPQVRHEHCLQKLAAEVVQLHERPTLNGCAGLIVGIDPAKAHYHVKLPEHTVRGTWRVARGTCAWEADA